MGATPAHAPRMADGGSETDDVLAQAGYDGDKIKALRKARIIA